MTLRNEWRYILNTRDCFIDLDGEVRQGDDIVEPYSDRYGNRVVTLNVESNEYDYETREWVRKPEEFYVWNLMMQTWFDGLPEGAHVYFVDGDPFNCHVDNLRAQMADPRSGGVRILQVREESWGYRFDKRLKGRIEVVETGDVYPGASEAAKAIGGTRSGVAHVLSGRLETHRGFHFRTVM